MRDLLHLVFEYRRLRAKSEALAGGALRPRAQGRLDALEKLFGQEPRGDSMQPRRHARCQISVPATLRLHGRVQPVSLVNLGGGGVCVTPAPNLPQGETALLRIVSEDQNRVYQYQVRVGWITRSEDRSQMGMPFVGIPRELPLQDDHLPLRSRE